jgi:hypothetical protein
MTSIKAVFMIAIYGVVLTGNQINEPPKKASFCEMASSPQTYDKKLVETDVLLESSEHSLGAYGPACIPTEKNDTMAQAVLPSSWNSTKMGKKLESLLRHQHRAKVGVVGTFYGSGGPYGPDVAPFRLTIERLTSVEETQKADIKPSEHSGTGTSAVIDPATGDLHIKIPVAARASAKR